MSLAADGPEGPKLVWAPIVEVRGRVSGTGDPFPDTRVVGQAARVGIQASRGILTARVSLQEVRSWTGDRQGLTGEGTFAPELAEGYARFDAVLSPSVGLRVTMGRQAIQVGDGRLLGLRDWDLEGQFLDAARVEAHAEPFDFELVNARRFEPDTEDPFGFGVTVFRLGIGRHGPTVDGQLDALSVVDARNTTFLTNTSGFSGAFTTGRLSLDGDTYIQQNSDGVGTSASGRVGWVVGRNRAWKVQGGYTAASGEPGERGGIAMFRPVLGDTHNTYGLLDLVLPGQDERGVSDVHIGGEVIAGQRLTLDLSAHRLGSAMRPVLYGYELDLAATWFVTPFATLRVGVGQAFGGELGLVGGGYSEVRAAF